jgi:oligoribonuclease
MPEVDEAFSYRVIDVSSVKELCRRLNPKVYARLNQEVKKLERHRVMYDINDTLNEYRFYRDNFLLAQPSE